MVDVADLAKSFTLHLQGGIRLLVFAAARFHVDAGECVVFAGPSGTGKSTALRLVYGNYRAQAGSIHVRHEGAMVDIASAEPHIILAVRRRSMGYVSQFLRCLPRVPALDVVAEPLLLMGATPAAARATAADLLARLNIPERLFELPPATFSGGEQQRVNIARGFAHPYPILLLDEPTASLDAGNRAVVVEMIGEAKTRGAAVLGIFHDRDVREAVADRHIDVAELCEAA